MRREGAKEGLKLLKTVTDKKKVQGYWYFSPSMSNIKCFGSNY